MLNKIIRFSLHNRAVVLACTLLTLIGGLYVTLHMEVDVFPDLNAPTVVVMTEAKGMAPEEVERLVTFPIETALNGATDVRRVRSSSTTGFSIVWVEFEWGTDIYKARQTTSEKLSTVQEQLPASAGNPTLGPQSSILGEMMIIGLTADSITDMQDLRTLADWVIRPRLLAIGGVSQVAVIGGEIKEYQILLNADKMRHYGVSLDEAAEAVRGMNDNATGGILYEHGNEYIIRGILSTNNPEDLASTVVKHTGTTPVLLQHIADVRTGGKRPQLGTASYRGKPAVLITVTKQAHVGTLNLTDKIEDVLADIQKTFPKDVNVSTDIFRQANFINNAIDNVKKSLYEGSFFVVIILFLFLMNVRTTVISLITIPLSILVSILALKAMGLTINTMSLGGIAIAIGSLVDDAIVDVENVYKRLRAHRFPADSLDIIYNASREVRMPILNSTLIIVTSFLPLFFLDGMEGRMLVPLGITFITSLFASTLVALTLTPVLCSYLLTGRKKEQAARDNDDTPYIVRKLSSWYLKGLNFSLAHRKSVIGCTLAVFVTALVMLFSFGRSFLPPFNEGSFTINVSTLPGISLEESERIGRMAEEMLLTVPEIKTVGRKTGRAELDEHALGVNTSEIEAPFELKDRSKEEVAAEIRKKFQILPGVNVEIGSPITHRIDAMLSGTQANIAIKLFGTDLNQLFTLGNQIKEAVSKIEGVTDLNVEQQVERPQLKITPKRHMLAQYGITLPQFSNIVSILLGGETVSQVYEGNRTFDLTLKVDDRNRNSIETIRNMTVDANGNKVPLCNIADVSTSSGPNTINRENVSRKIVVSANATGRDLHNIVNDMRKSIGENIHLPEGYHIEYGGQFESEQAASRTILITSVFSILIILLLLYREFNSLPQSVIMLLNLPLALIGGVFSVAVSGGILSIPAIIGFISLFGIATRNGMLLVDRYNTLLDNGVPLRECIVRGSLDRLNPILMTALSSGLALIPLAWSGDLPGNEIQSPMAKVILGGLISSTLLNGIVVPIMYLYLKERTIQPSLKQN